MIVIGVDVHKQSVAAVAIDDASRMLDERTVAVGSNELREWAAVVELGAAVGARGLPKADPLA